MVWDVHAVYVSVTMLVAPLSTDVAECNSGNKTDQCLTGELRGSERNGCRGPRDGVPDDGNQNRSQVPSTLNPDLIR